jgi:uncharacterized protein YqfB (UPF0267 family)
MKKFKPELIKFKTIEFNTALNLYNQKVKIENNIENFFLHKINTEQTPNFEDDIYNQALNVLVNDPLNVMKLEPEKYAQLKNIPLYELKELIKEYTKLKRHVLPNEENYSVYTQNERENANFKAYKDFIDAYYKLIENLPPGSFNRYDFYKAFGFWLDWNHSTHTVQPYDRLIKL